MTKNPIAHGRVTFCQACDGSGDNGHYHGSTTCYTCGGYGLLFDGKDFSTSLTTTTVIPDMAGENLIRPADQLHQAALRAHHKRILTAKLDAVNRYWQQKLAYEGSIHSLRDLKIEPSELEAIQWKQS